MVEVGLRQCSVLRVGDHCAIRSHMFYLMKSKIVSNLHIR